MLKNIKIVQYFGGIIVAFWVSFGALALLAWLGLPSSTPKCRFRIFGEAASK